MNFINFIKYDIWSAVKVRLTFYWWIIKYGGKKNIPKELIFARMAKSMERMNENLMKVIRRMPKNMTEEEKKELIGLVRNADMLEKEVKKHN